MGMFGNTPHFVQDGTSVIQAFNKLLDESQGKDEFYPFLKIRDLNLFQWFMIYITAPYQMFNILKSWVSRKPDVNCIKQHGSYMSGRLKSKNVLTISTPKAKELAKKNSSTLNELFLAILSTTLKEYFCEKKDESTHVTVSVPFSFRTIPKRIKDYVYCNKFASMCIYLGLESSLNSAIKMAKDLSENQIKRSPGGSFFLAKMYVKLMSITSLAKFNLKFGTKHSFIFSNVPAFVMPTHLCGMELQRIYLLITGTGPLATGISLISVTDQIQCNICSDVSQIKDLDLFVSIFNRKITEHGIAYNDK